MRNLQALIMRHTMVTRQHLTPELPLRLITPDCEMWTAKTPQPFPSDPYWAFYWPGGQALARFILDGANSVRNKRVLDVGAGCGACSIAAAKLGASYVLANDIDECAAEAIAINTKLNEVTLDFSKDNLIGSDCIDFDIVLIGDMFYDDEFSENLFAWLGKISRSNKTILIGDPGRHGLTERRFKILNLLRKYEITNDNVMKNNGFRSASVWQLLPATV